MANCSNANIDMLSLPPASIVPTYKLNESFSAFTIVPNKESTGTTKSSDFNIAIFFQHHLHLSPRITLDMLLAFTICIHPQPPPTKNAPISFLLFQVTPVAILPCKVEHSIPYFISSLPYNLVDRELLFTLLLSVDSSRQISLKPSAHSNHTAP